MYYATTGPATTVPGDGRLSDAASNGFVLVPYSSRVRLAKRTPQTPLSRTEPMKCGSGEHSRAPQANLNLDFGLQDEKNGGGQRKLRLSTPDTRLLFSVGLHPRFIEMWGK